MIGSNTYPKSLTFLDDAKIVVDASTKEYLQCADFTLTIPIKVENAFFLNKLVDLLTDRNKNIYRFYEKQTFTATSDIPISGDNYTLRDIGENIDELKPFLDELSIFCTTFRHKKSDTRVFREMNFLHIIKNLYIKDTYTVSGIAGFLEITAPYPKFLFKEYTHFKEFSVHKGEYIQMFDGNFLNSCDTLEVTFGLPSKIIHDIYKNVSLEIPVFNDYSELRYASSIYKVYWKGHSVYLKSTGKVHHFRSKVDYIDTITTGAAQPDTPIQGYYATEDFGKVFLADSLYYPQERVIPLAGQIINLDPDKYTCLRSALFHGRHGGEQFTSCFTQQPSSNSTYKVIDLKTANYANTSLMPYIVID